MADNIFDLAVPASKTVESINAIIYGESGAGKTHFAGTGKDHGKNDLIIAIEHGTVSAARAGSQASVLKVDDWDTLIQVVEAVENEPARFDWVILDSATALQDIIWNQIIADAVASKPGRSAFKKELQEYGEAQEMFKSIIRRLFDSEANVIILALPTEAVNEEGETYKLPQVHGQKGDMAKWFAAQPDLLGYLSVVKTKAGLARKLQFNKTPEVYVKDRFAVFKGPQKNLTLEEMTDKLTNAGTQEAPADETKKKENK